MHFPFLSMCKCWRIACTRKRNRYSYKISFTFTALFIVLIFFSIINPGVVGVAMVLNKLPVPGRPTNLYYSGARAYCACSRCGWWWFESFFSHLLFLFSSSLSLWESTRYRLKYCLKGPLSQKTTNQPTYHKPFLI